MYTVIYSSNPYLLARMATDLQMGGGRKIEINDDSYNPFTGMDKETEGELHCHWLGLYDAKTFGFYNHNCGYDNPITLTSRNYLKVLGAILNSKK